MRKTLILARRELAAYFVSPMAYVIGAMFLGRVGLLSLLVAASGRMWAEESQSSRLL